MPSLKFLSALIAGFCAGIFCLILINSASSKVLVSKIQIAGASTTDEFVELYNAGADNAPLSNYSLKKLTASGNASNLVSSFPSIIINPWSYFLIAHRDYTPVNGTTADLAYSNNSTSLASNNSAVIYDANGTEVDRVGWGDIPAGKSYTRLPNDNTGNGADSDSAADFIILDSNPFNSLSPARGPTIAEPTAEATTTPTESTDSLGSPSSTEQETTDATTTVETTIFEIINTTTIWAKIKINEFVPNPTSGEEWIELYNPSTSSLDLTGGTLCDSRTSTSCTIASPTGTISAGGFLVIYLTFSRLNNDGDAIILKNPDGAIVDQITYAGALVPGKGESVARKTDGIDVDNNTDWAVTTIPTPGAVNVIAEPASPVAPTKNTNSGSSYVPPQSNQPCSGPACAPPSSVEILPAYSASNTPIVINELLPNPEDSDINDEFIELKNISDKTIDLTGWKIADLSTIYKMNGKLGAGRLLVLPRPLTDIALNNTSVEAVTLFAPGGIVVDQTKYNKADEGLSYGRTASGTWEWSETVTRNKENVFTFASPIAIFTTQTLAAAPEASSTLKKADTKKQTAPKSSAAKSTAPYLGRVSLTDARAADKGSKVIVRGIVTASPGIFGSQTFYLSDETSGLEIFQSKKQFPALALNDYLEIAGTVSEANGIKRINVKNKTAIKILKSANVTMAPVATTIDQLSEDQAGLLVSVSGEITQIKTNQIYLDDGEAEGEVYLKKGAQINKGVYKLGDQIEITGVVEKSKLGLQIWPRGNADIKILGLSSDAINKQLSAEAEQNKKLKEEYTAATAGGLTTVILAWLARARGLALVGGIKRVGALAVGIIKKEKA